MVWSTNYAIAVLVLATLQTVAQAFPVCTRSPNFLGPLTCNQSNNTAFCDFDYGSCCGSFSGCSGCCLDSQNGAIPSYEFSVAVLRDESCQLSDEEVQTLLNNANVVLKRETGLDFNFYFNASVAVSSGYPYPDTVITKYYFLDSSIDERGSIPSDVQQFLNILLTEDANGFPDDGLDLYSTPYQYIAVQMERKDSDLRNLLHMIGRAFGAEVTSTGCLQQNPVIPITQTAFERGAGVSIMGFPNCVRDREEPQRFHSPNPDSNLDLFYHSVSLQQMRQRVKLLEGYFTGTFSNPTLLSRQHLYNFLQPKPNGEHCSVPYDTSFGLLNHVDSVEFNDDDGIWFTWEQVDAATSLHSVTASASESASFFQPKRPHSQPYRSLFVLNAFSAPPPKGTTLHFVQTVRELREDGFGVWASSVEPIQVSVSEDDPVKLTWPTESQIITSSDAFSPIIQGISATDKVELYFKQSANVSWVKLDSESFQITFTNTEAKVSPLKLGFDCAVASEDAQFMIQVIRNCNVVAFVDVVNFEIRRTCQEITIDISETRQDILFGVGQNDDYPDYFYPYWPNVNVKWNLIVKEGLRAHLIFEKFDLDNTDVMQVFEGLELGNEYIIAEASGSELPDQVWTKGNKMGVTFVTDASVAGQGIVARFTEAGGRNPPPFPPTTIAAISGGVVVLVLATLLVVRQRVNKRHKKRTKSTTPATRRSSSVGSIDKENAGHVDIVRHDNIATAEAVQVAIALETAVLPDPEEYNTILDVAPKAAGFGVSFDTRFFAQYYRNERKNLQCFPNCPYFGEYAFAKASGKQHKNGHLCSSHVTVQVVAPKLVNQGDLVVLGRIGLLPVKHSKKSKKVDGDFGYDDVFTPGTTITQDVLDKMVTSCSVVRGRNQEGPVNSHVRTFTLAPGSSLFSWDYQDRLKRDRPARAFGFHTIVLCKRSYFTTADALGTVAPTNRLSMGSRSSNRSLGVPFPEKPRLLPSGSHDSSGMLDAALLLGHTTATGSFDENGPLDMSWLDEHHPSFDDLNASGTLLGLGAGDLEQFGSLEQSTYIVVARACSSAFDISTTKALKKTNKKSTKRNRNKDEPQDPDEEAREKSRQRPDASL